MNFSFAGCGFLGIYHVGVAACLRKYAPNLLINKIAGASAGALAAVLLLCDCPLGTITSSVLKTATEARKRALGPFSPTFNVEKLLREGLLSVLPPDAHIRVSGKLFISVTRVSDGKNILLSNFETYEELVQAILASAFIPVFSGWMPKIFRGVAYLDGAFSDNLPILDGRTITVSPFKGESDICPADGPPSFLQALLCSAFIPAFSGWSALKIKGVRYVDGGFSDNLPQLDENTVTVSPFCGEADICPKDMNAGIMTVSLANTSIELSRENLYRFAMILFPPPPEILNRMCQQGFNDTLDFLQRNYLINCTRCLAISSTFNLEEKKVVQKEIAIDFDEPCENCEDCKLQRQEAILDQLPEAVGSIFQEAVDVANKGLVNWVFKHKSMKVVSIMSLPYILPAEIAYVAFIKFMDVAPSVVKDWKILAAKVIEVVRLLFKSWLRRGMPPHQHPPRHHHDNKFSCQFAITEFTGEGERAAIAVDNRNKFNFSIGLDIDEVDNLPQSHKDALTMESEALNQLALRCAARSLSSLASRAASRNPSRVASKNPSRAVSRAVSRIPSMENLSVPSPDWENLPHHVPDDAFDQILEVTSRQDAVMAYYYMDDNNEMRVTEIFDMSQDMVDVEIKQMETLNRIHMNQQISKAELQSQLLSFKDLDVGDDKFKTSYETLGSNLSLDGTTSEPEADQAY